MSLVPRTSRDFLHIAALAAVYASVGMVTLALPESGLALNQMVWLPSGIALGWMLVSGIHLWPGVFIGAVIISVLTGGGVIHAITGTGIANAAEAVAGVWLLNKWCDRPRIESRVDLFRFLAVILLTAGLSAILSVWSLVLHSDTVLPASSTAVMRWLTHAMGQVTITPLFLSLPTKSRPLSRMPVVESILMMLGLAVTSTVSFTAWTPAPLQGAPLAFLIFPFLFWAAYRCGAFGASTASIAVATFAITGTLLDVGPFVRESANASLFLTLLFVSGIQLSTLFVAGLVGERKHAEAAREALERRLHRAEKLESLGALAGGIAHDFKNLLVAISGNVDLALMDMDPSDPNYGPLQESAKASTRAAELCRQLLGYAAQGPFEDSIWDLESIVGDMQEPLQEAAKVGTAVDYELTSDALPVRADPDQLRQVLVSLCSNAWEALPAKGGRVGVSTSLVSDHTELESRGIFMLDPPAPPCAQLQVEDDGEGISPDDFERVFQPVFSTRGAGRGIGLASSLGIVLRHNGSIHVESTPGQGSRFTVLLPLGEIEDGELSPPPIIPL